MPTPSDHSDSVDLVRGVAKLEEAALPTFGEIELAATGGTGVSYVHSTACLAHAPHFGRDSSHCNFSQSLKAFQIDPKQIL